MKGFSLVELMSVMVVAGLLLAVGAVSLRGSTVSAGSRAAAMMVRAELIAARDLAKAEQRPVAVRIPSGGGTLAHSSWLYWQVGATAPAITRRLSVSEDNSPVSVFAGYWNLDASVASGNSIDAPTGVSFPFDLWDDRSSPDPTILFTPEGQVLTNDLTTFDGAWHLVVASGVDYSSASAPPGTATVTTPPPYALLHRACRPYTIAITPSGSITIESGVKAASKVVILEDPIPTPGAVPPPPDGLGTNAPAIASAVGLPEPAPGSLPPGIDALVARDAHLTLRVYATDLDRGEQLYSRWVARKTAGTGSEPGHFSSPGRQPLDYDYDSGQWKGDWEWTPPEGAQAGDEYEFETTVIDSNGLTSTSDTNARISLRLQATDKIVFARNNDIWTVRPDGQELRNLTNSASREGYPSLTADGQRVVFFSDRGGDEDIYLMNLDGSGLIQLTNLPGAEYSPAISPTGEQLAYFYKPGGFNAASPIEIRVQKLDGSGLQVIHSKPSGWPDCINWSADGLAVAYDSGGVTVKRVDGTGPIIGLSGLNDPRWDTSDPARAIVVGDNGSTGYRRVELDLASGTVLSDTTYTLTSPNQIDDLCVSPDGTKVCYVTGKPGDLIVSDQDGSNAKMLVPTPVVGTFWAR